MGIEIRISAGGVVHVETSRSYTECGEEGEKRSFDFFDDNAALKSHIGDALALAFPRRKAEAAALSVTAGTGEWTDSAPPPKPAEPDVDLRGLSPAAADAEPTSLMPCPPEKTVTIDLPPVLPTLPAPKKNEF